VYLVVEMYFLVTELWTNLLENGISDKIIRVLKGYASRPDFNMACPCAYLPSLGMQNVGSI